MNLLDPHLGHQTASHLLQCYKGFLVPLGEFLAVFHSNLECRGLQDPHAAPALTSSVARRSSGGCCPGSSPLGWTFQRDRYRAAQCLVVCSGFFLRRFRIFAANHTRIAYPGKWLRYTCRADDVPTRVGLRMDRYSVKVSLASLMIVHLSSFKFGETTISGTPPGPATSPMKSAESLTSFLISSWQVSVDFCSRSHISIDHSRSGVVVFPPLKGYVWARLLLDLHSRA